MRITHFWYQIYLDILGHPNGPTFGVGGLRGRGHCKTRAKCGCGGARCDHDVVIGQGERGVVECGGGQAMRRPLAKDEAQ